MSSENAVKQILETIENIGGDPNNGIHFTVPFEDGFLSIGIHAWGKPGVFDVLIWKCKGVGETGVAYGKEYGYWKLKDKIFGPIFDGHTL
jgi:hypothetical protein